MKTTQKITLGMGKVLLAILGCVLMPVLIWVGLGAAIYQKDQKSTAEIAPEITGIDTETNRI